MERPTSIGISAIIRFDVSRSDFGDDHWFAGWALRQELTKEWTILAESYALLPHTGAGGNANVYFSGGPQWNISEHIIFSALIGTAAGHKSPDLTGTLEISCQF
jgi:hypothetical protein